VRLNVVLLRQTSSSSSIDPSQHLGRVSHRDDSDIHLVIADTGDRTMIAEMPAPQCVGASSPFPPSIRYVRSKFTSQFHPSSSWHRGNTKVQIAGVGFFDFKHGQSGVAPNAIELHPVLQFSVGAGSSAPPPAPPVGKPQPTVRPSGSFLVRAAVSPNPVSYGSYPTLYAFSSPGAVCTASVLYSTGSAPVSFSGSSQTVGASRKVGWSCRVTVVRGCRAGFREAWLMTSFSRFTVRSSLFRRERPFHLDFLSSR
jgi:hypothetical protein